MKKDKQNNTILVWTENQTIIRYTSEVAKELKLNIYKADIETDLIAIPCFLIIVDTEKLKDEFLKDLSLILKHINSKEQSILVFGKRLTTVPYHVRPFLTYLNRVITKEKMLKVIEKAWNNQKKNIKQDMFKNRIHRIIYLYKLLDEGKVLSTKEMSDFFEMSDRTLRRDIKILRDVCDQEIMFDKESGYYFQP